MACPWNFIPLFGASCQDLVEVLNCSLVSGSLPTSLRCAFISLVFEKGDRLEHKNWRPISLLNVDYKLCARSLAGRILNVLHQVIALDQTCGVRGHFIGENVPLRRDVIHNTSESGTPAAILSLDQEKAFDRVDWPFLFRVLEHLGFSPSFISWVQLLYTDICSAILINGYASNCFFPSRGVRRGCPLSPLLYVTSIEVLAANLLFSETNPEAMWNVWKNLFMEVVDKHVPLQSKWVSNKHSPWITYELTRKIHKQIYMKKIAFQENSATAWERYK